MVGNRGTLNSDSSPKMNDSVWEHIVTEALKTDMTADEYIEFIKFIKKLSANKRNIDMPITHYFQVFHSGTSH
ncbi:hypothetical protein [Halalkalibacter urbisdiaboli]|uniref:hypothetical protein n=1 Tax=Halalkalibacter urbisdiaboli TaxID=1960589 RepID=UPI000B430A78|nr:hypothetical protein [Halalkalibacter urbisdiaboli]